MYSRISSMQKSIFLLINIVFLTVMYRFSGEGCLCLWKSKLLLKSECVKDNAIAGRNGELK